MLSSVVEHIQNKNYMEVERNISNVDKCIKSVFAGFFDAENMLKYKIFVLLKNETSLCL